MGVGGLENQERFDVAGLDAGPVLLPAVGDEEAGKVTHDGKVLLDRPVGLRTRPDAERAFSSSKPRVEKASHRRAQGLRCGIEATLTSPGGQALGLVERPRQPLGNEILLQGDGETAHRAAGPSGALEQALGVDGTAIGKQASEPGDEHARAPHAVPGCDVGDKAIQPDGRITETGREVGTLSEGAVRVGLSAPIAHAVSTVASPFAAHHALPWGLWSRARP